MSGEALARLRPPGPVGGTRSQGRYPCFDGLRAIAALTVLVTHVSYITGENRRGILGSLYARMDGGVAIFFLISGFLLYRPFAAAHLEGRRRPAVGPYLGRRALRIFPAYWLVLAVVVVFFGGAVGGARQAVQYLTLTHTYTTDTYLGPMSAAGGRPLGLAWTLSAEVSFYLLLPLWAALMAWRPPRAPRARLRRELTSLAGLFAAALAYRVLVLSVVAPDLTAPLRGALVTWLPNQLDLFAAGMALAVVAVWHRAGHLPAPAGTDRRWAPAASWALAGLTFWVVARGVGLPLDAVPYTNAEEYTRHYLYGLTALFLILPAVFGPQDQGLIRGFLRNPVVVWLGLVSYGIYLWQNLAIEQTLEALDLSRYVDRFGTVPPGHFGTVLAIVAVAAVAVASASWLALERPVLRLKRNLGPPAVPTATSA